MNTYNPFIKAVPVWPLGRAEEMNLTCRFTAEVKKTDKPVMLRMAGSTVYRVFVGGKIAAYGPARGPKNWFRVDEIPMNRFLCADENIIVIEVMGGNINNFYTMDQPSFLQAELLIDGVPAAWTAAEGGMPCDIITERVQKVEKYS
ncbi:MAG: hypothetical protein MJ175_13245, partial [Clostridia bacterium]|nr:hypothetical protein [Clostridia bacterium]